VALSSHAHSERVFSVDLFSCVLQWVHSLFGASLKEATMQVGERCLLSLEERVAGLYLFYALYSDYGIFENPFCPYLIEVSTAVVCLMTAAPGSGLDDNADHLGFERTCSMPLALILAGRDCAAHCSHCKMWKSH
jgi:hypothetical protein